MREISHEDDDVNCIPDVILDDVEEDREPLEIIMHVTSEEDQKFMLYDRNGFKLECADTKGKILRKIDIMQVDCDDDECFETKVIDKLHETNYKEILYENSLTQELCNATFEHACNDKAMNETFSVSRASF